MAIIAEQYYTGDSTNRSFTVNGTILSESHIAVYVDNIRQPTSDYDIIGSRVLFINAPITNSVIRLLLTDDGEGLDTPPSAIITVSQYLNQIDNVSDNMSSFVNVSDNADSIISVSDNMIDLLSVNDIVVANLSELLLVDTNAQLAVSKALEAYNSALNALQSKNDVIAIENRFHTLNVATGITSTNVEYNSTTNTITIPRGSVGSSGNNGMTPILEFTYNSSTGNLEYEVVGYDSISEASSQEWE